MKIVKNKSINIYCTYHDQDLIESYKLDSLDPDLYTLYYTKEGHPLSFDSIEQYINEFTTQAWVWRNRVKSDYLGFCHYRRVFTFGETHTLEDALEVGLPGQKVLGFFYQKDLCWEEVGEKKFCGFLYNDFTQYILEKYSPSDKAYRYFITNRTRCNYPFLMNELYITSWEIFSEMMEVLCGFVEWEDRKWGLGFQGRAYHEFTLKGFIDPRLTIGLIDGNTGWLLENEGRNFWRIYSVFLEYLIGIWLGYESSL